MTFSEAQANFASCAPAIQAQTQVTNASADHAANVANHILTNHNGGDVLVVGHSNTVPKIVEALGAASLCPDLAPLDANGECHVPGSQFDNLFVVTVIGKSQAKSVRLRYGGVTP